MLLIDPQLTASQVLGAFHRDEPYLFLGAAFTTVGLIAIALLVIRRRFDPLLFWLALSAILYGNRMWINSELLTMTVPRSAFFTSLRAIITYAVPIPAFFFFRAAGFLGRFSKIFTYVASIFFGCLIVATLVFGARESFRYANNVVIITVLLILVVQSFRRVTPGKDFAVIRFGLLVFVAFALWNNIMDTLGIYFRTEPYGFVVFLGCLGYVAARRTVERDHLFNEIKKELEIAKRIQLSILPGKFPASANFHVAARYVPMTSVAGDFYDFLIADETQAGLLIADVSGHGVPAALIASMVKLAATSQRVNAGNPAELLSGMNAALFGNTQQQFITAAYVHLDAETGKLRYSAAGHPPMLLLRGGQVSEVAENGLMLAAFDFATYSTAVHSLQSGDRLVLYTDGIVEAANAREEEFGQARLCALLQQTAGLSLAETTDRILSEVQQWSASQDDDLTLLVCEYRGLTSA